jgi:hypothetical protein
MTTNELKSALERRGFHIIVWIPEQDRLRTVVRLGDFSMPWVVSLESLESIRVSIGEFITIAFISITRGQEVMACAQCGEPLLYHAKYVDEQQQCLKWYGCRSPKAGAHSELLSACPGCGIKFDYPPPVREIED